MCSRYRLWAQEESGTSPRSRVLAFIVLKVSPGHCNGKRDGDPLGWAGSGAPSVTFMTILGGCGLALFICHLI